MKKLFINIVFSPEFEVELKKHFSDDGDAIDKCRQKTASSFATVLDTTRNQIRSVFWREGAKCLDVAFLITLEKDKFCVEIFVFPIPNEVPTTKDVMSILMPLLEQKITIPVKNIIDLMPAPASNFLSLKMAQRLVADFSRDGLPVEMKRIIAETSKVFRKAVMPGTGWMNA